MDYQEKYNDLLGKAEARIAGYVKISEPANLYEPFSYFISGGGKRIRPVLAMIAAGATCADPESALDAGVAIEIMHNFTLVHDDIMDKSPMRRGRPTVHTKWDEAVAILTGDIMIGWGYRLLGSYTGMANYSRMVDIYTDGLVEVCEGQGYDMDFNNRKDITLDEYLLMIEKKTARLLETSAVLGGLAGNADSDELAKLRLFARNMGMAFQIKDDLLDLFADEKKLGKTIGKDIVEGKKTYLIIKALEKAKEKDDMELLDKFIANNGLPYEYVPAMRDMMMRLGVYEDTAAAADQYHQQAEKVLAGLRSNDMTEMLHWLLNKLGKREF